MAALTANGVGTCGADDNQAQAGHLIAYVPDVAATLSRGSAASPGVNPPGRRQEDDENLIVGTLTARYHKGTDSDATDALVVGVLGEQSHALTAEGHDASEDGTGRGTPVIALHLTQDPISGAVTPAMGTGNKQGCATLGISDGVTVRRLTPLECERLQGYPDGWTDVEGTSDSQRYRELGNSVAVPVFEWTFARIIAVDAREQEADA